MTDANDSDGYRAGGHKSRSLRGMTPALSKAKVGLALIVRDKIPTTVLVQWKIEIAKGNRPKLAESKSGEIVVVVEKEGGIAPTLKERDDAINWLADRGHGLAVQQIALEASINATSRATTTELRVVELHGPGHAMELAGILGRMFGPSPGIASLPAPIDVGADAAADAAPAPVIDEDPADSDE